MEKDYDSQSRCPKCGDLATTKFKDNYGYESMIRRCIRCSYTWHERPLDSEDDGKLEKLG